MAVLPRIAVTMGDPAGVGPELCLRLLADEQVSKECCLALFGCPATLRRVADVVALPLVARSYSIDDWRANSTKIDYPCIVEPPRNRPGVVTPGVISAATGLASFTYVEKAIDAALGGYVDAIVTAPISKEALHLAGIDFPGHTEIFAARTHAPRSCMMQYSDEITCSFVTTHVGYRDVPALLTKERILDCLELTAEALETIRGRRPKIVVCGLNPHAGEHGLFGDREEERIIQPAIEAARAKGIDVHGPVPPDTAFLPATRKATDAFVCMYHDQGHIPVKALAFDSAVNTTLGLPIIRTSVDHGTARDIAWQGKASPGSLFAAARLAKTLAMKKSGSLEAGGDGAARCAASTGRFAAKLT